nr:uncharacterized protein LOC113813955 [Penaeus vannamei]
MTFIVVLRGAREHNLAIFGACLLPACAPPRRLGFGFGFGFGRFRFGNGEANEANGGCALICFIQSTRQRRPSSTGVAPAGVCDDHGKLWQRCRGRWRGQEGRLPRPPAPRGGAPPAPRRRHRRRRHHRRRHRRRRRRYDRLARRLLRGQRVGSPARQRQLRGSQHHRQRSYGTVYCARDRNNPDRVVALKKIRITLNEDGVPGNAVREIALLKQLERFEHPNIVR